VFLKKRFYSYDFERVGENFFGNIERFIKVVIGVRSEST